MGILFLGRSGRRLWRFDGGRYIVIPTISRPLVAALFLAGCMEFDEPEPVDPAPILGCYTAPNAPFINVAANGVSIEHLAESIPFSYQQRKVGMIIVMPVLAQTADGQFDFRRSEDHFYRVIHTSRGPLIRIAFGPQGFLKDYKRQSSADCEI